MRPITWVAALGLASLCGMAGAQAPPGGAAGAVNRLSVRYRTLESYSHTAAWSRGPLNATVALAMQRPNRYLLDFNGDGMAMWVCSDGKDVVAFRPDAKQFTRASAPASLIRTDILARTDVPSPAGRIITLLMQANLRQSRDPLAQALLDPVVSATASGYTLTLPYDPGRVASVTVGSDNLIRKVTLLRGGTPEVTETLTKVTTDQPIPAGTFARKVPDGGFEMVKTLPAFKFPAVAEGTTGKDFTLETVDGSTVTLSKLRGKVVLLFFMFDG